jgi:eukaryotic-like serine/threonine-protein kinase
VKGLTFEDAERQLTDLGFTVKRQDKDSAEPEGTVLGTTPAEGQAVAKGAEVTVLVSNGKATVPGVVGFTADEAIKRLTDKGFDNITQQRQESPDGNYTVIAQDPPGGSLAKPTDEITIVIAVPPAQTSTPPTTPSTQPTTPSQPPTTPPPTGSPTPTISLPGPGGH